MPGLRSITRVKSLKNEDAAYIAGLVDGEGTVRLSKTGRGFIYPTIKVTNTNKEVLLWLKDTIGCGAITCKNRNSSNLKHKDCFTWELFSKIDVATLFAQLKPFLKIKVNFPLG